MLVLHVGPHKTATTWLQTNFHQNARLLRAKGWLYPQTGERVRIAHHDLSDFPKQILDPDSRKVAEFKRIAAQSQKHGLNVLLSSEGFRNWKPRHLKALQAIFHPHPLHIVYTLRDPVALLYSFWAQKVQTGAKAGLPAFVTRQLSRPGHSIFLNPLIEVRRLAAIPEAQLSLLALDAIQLAGHDIFDVFVSDILKLEPLEKVTRERVNERHPIEMTEFMRLLIIRAGKWRGRDQLNIGRVFRYLVTSAKKRQIIEAVKAVGSARKTLEMERRLRCVVRAERLLLARYRDRIVPTPEGDRLFPSGTTSFVYYDEAILEQDPTVRRLVDELQQRLRPKGLAMRAANLAKSVMIGWRRFLKKLRS